MFIALDEAAELEEEAGGLAPLAEDNLTPEARRMLENADCVEIPQHVDFRQIRGFSFELLRNAIIMVFISNSECQAQG